LTLWHGSGLQAPFEQPKGHEVSVGAELQAPPLGPQAVAERVAHTEPMQHPEAHVAAQPEHLPFTQVSPGPLHDWQEMPLAPHWVAVSPARHVSPSQQPAHVSALQVLPVPPPVPPSSAPPPAPPPIPPPVPRCPPLRPRRPR
jgi:hypothetical protein